MSCAASEAKVVALASPGLAEGSAVDGCRPALTGKGGPVAWQVTRPATATSGAAITETSREQVDTRYPICIVDSITATDVDIGVDFTPLGGQLDQAAGLIFRVQDPDNYYVVRANALENNVRLYRTVNGERRQFAGADVTVSSGKMQHLQIRVEGDRITVTFEGKQLYKAYDRTFPARGTIGLWTKADSSTVFTTLTVTILKE
jgi:hypothetical protein